MAWGLLRLRKRAGYSPAYRVWGYPFVPLVFVASSAYIVVNQIVHDPKESAVGLLLVLAGLPIYYLWLRTPSSSPSAAQHAD
jgi:APA family basic amino acid/polyamine antiporter